MTQKQPASGGAYTDADIERWGDESDSGFEQWEFGTSRRGRPISVGNDAKPFTLRLDSERRAKLNEIASEHDVTPSELVRNLIDELIDEGRNHAFNRIMADFQQSRDVTDH